MGYGLHHDKRGSTLLLYVYYLFILILGIWNTYKISRYIIGQRFPALQLRGCWCWFKSRTRVAFEHFCFRDYVDQQTLIDQNLNFAGDNTFIILWTKHNTALDANGPGRNSKSKNVYANHVVIWQYRLEFNSLALVSICAMCHKNAGRYSTFKTR